MEYRGKNYLFLNASDFENYGQQVFLKYKEIRLNIENTLGQIKNNEETMNKIRKTLILIQQYQTINDTVNQIGDMSKSLSRKINDDTQEKLRMAFEDAAKQVVQQGGIDPAFAKIDFTKNVNIKKALKDYSFQGLSSEQEMEEKIIQTLYDEYRKNNKNIDLAFGKKYGYDKIIGALKELKNTKKREKGWQIVLHNAIEEAWKEWKKVGAQPIGAAQIKLDTKAHFLELLRKKINNGLNSGTRISFSGENQSMKSVFSETLIKNVYNIVDNEKQEIMNLFKGKADVTGEKRESHIYKTLEYKYDENTGKIVAEAISQHEELKGKQIKTDISIIDTNENSTRTNISAKFYDFSDKRYPEITLENMNILKVLDLNNQDLVSSYNNYFVFHEDRESETYKENKTEAITFLGFLMLVRAWSSAGYEGYIKQQEQIGPAGIFIVMDNTKSNIYMIDINKYLTEQYKNINSFNVDNYITGDNKINANTILNYNNIKNNYNTWQERNIDILNNLIRTYRETSYHIVISKQEVLKYSIYNKT